MITGIGFTGFDAGAQPTNTFAAWCATSLLAAGVNGPTDDPDGDDSPNILEYAFGLNPNVRDAEEARPRAGVVSVAGQHYPTLTFRQPDPAPTDLTYLLRSSTNLTDWGISLAVPVGAPVVGSNWVEVTVRSTNAWGADPQGFIQLQVCPDWSRIRIPWPAAFHGVNVDMARVAGHDLLELSQGWNVHMIRINLRLFQIRFIQDDDAPYDLNEADLWQLDRYIDLCERLGLRVILANHRPLGSATWFMPGGPDKRIWSDFQFHDYLIYFWQQLAQRYANRGPVIAGYELMNEPDPNNQVTGTPSDWNLLAGRITSAIRETDKVHPIVVDAINAAASSFPVLQPTGDDNSVYSFHCYSPWQFTGQGISGSETNIVYPGFIAGEYWDQNRLLEELRPVITFQQSNNVPILAGEFSVVRWAPSDSAARYFSNIVDICSTQHWPWLYWDFRECSSCAWDLETDGTMDNPITVGTNSTRFQVLWPSFARNKKWSGPLTGKPFVGPKVLFDEFHAEMNTLSPEAAVLRDPLHPDWHLFGDFKKMADDYFSMIRSVQPLGYDLLSTSRALILAVPSTPLSDQEETSVLRFVREGGGLLVLGNSGMGPVINSLLQNFGVAFGNGTLASHTASWDAQSFMLTNLNQAHFVSKGVSEVWANWSGFLQSTGAATALVTAGPETWHDLNYNGNQDSGEPGGPFAFAVATQYGAGRVVVVADNGFSDSMIVSGENRRFILHALIWLVEHLDVSALND
jgi:hypothetical protein